MFSRRVTLLVTISCFLFSFGISANGQSAETVVRTKQTTAADTKLEVNDPRSNEARLAHAIQIASSLADEARTYNNESLRARVQAQAASALWGADQERARALFHRAWDVAQVVDKEGQQRFLARRPGTGMVPPTPNLRAEVLRFASRCDPALAEEFLAEMEAEQNKLDQEGKSKPWDPTAPPDAIAKRLNLAMQLLEDGDVERARLVAEPGLQRATSPGIAFLVFLRAKHATSADALFASLLEQTATDPAADATSVSLLSSYVLTPWLSVTLTKNGLATRSWAPKPLPPPQLSSTLRARFFSTTAQVLLRPLDATELELTSAGLAGTFFTIQRLLPLFEQSVPTLAAALHSRLSVLAQGKDQVLPERIRGSLNIGLSPIAEKEEELEDKLADSIARAPNAGARDYLYARAAREALMKNNPKAGEFADKIEGTELKTSVRAFVSFILLSRALDKKDLDTALRLVRVDELSHLQRAWALLEIAVLLKSSEPEQSLDAMSKGIEEAGRIPVASPEAAQAWVAIARRTTDVAPSNKWQTILDAIKAINKAPEYTGRPNSLLVNFRNGKDIAMMEVATPSTDLSALFKTLAQDDLYRTTELAKGITSESPRSVALLALAASVLNKSLPNESRR